MIKCHFISTRTQDIDTKHAHLNLTKDVSHSLSLLINQFLSCIIQHLLNRFLMC